MTLPTNMGTLDKQQPPEGNTRSMFTPSCHHLSSPCAGWLGTWLPWSDRITTNQLKSGYLWFQPL